MTFLERALWIADKDHWEEEHKHLQNVFRRNGYSLLEIKRAFTIFDNENLEEEEKEPIHGLAVVPFYQTDTNRLTRLLRHKQIQTTSYPLLKLY